MARLPVIALVGRPNVGKSTLFNRFTRSRAALVADVPGLTRDRQYGRGRVGEREFIVIDSGGFEPVAREGIAVEMARQTRQAVLEADGVIFLVDGREGLTPHDLQIGVELRRTAQNVLVAVNKTEGMRREIVAAEFHELGLGTPLAVSASHGDGISDLVDEALASFDAAVAARDTPQTEPASDAGEGDFDADPDGDSETDPEANETERVHTVRVAVVGRPNVGKSTLINTLLGEERLIAFDQPGTTRDAVAIDFERGGRPYTLVDTAGLRRRGKVDDMVEKFSAVKTLQAIEDANVCILLLDATDPVSDQDSVIAGYVLEAGRALVIAVNKWDAASPAQRDRLKVELDRRMHFLSFAKLHFISALKGAGVGAVMRSVDGAHAAAYARLSTPRLTRVLRDAVEQQAPPRRGPIRPKLRYAHQGGQNPPIVVIHGTSLDRIPDTYRRYLESTVRSAFSLQGTPLRIEFRTGANPYAQRG
ncbi:MAG: ribosome biogenesis GTPase Der [Betaproteobacteria bacterium]|nr:ribosome biogenesis GTPase Der [Betaproteobacteria bacterium]